MLSRMLSLQTHQESRIPRSAGSLRLLRVGVARAERIRHGDSVGRNHQGTRLRGGRRSSRGSTTAQHALDTVDLLRSVVGAQGADEQEEDENHGADDNRLAAHGVVDAKLGPGPVGLASVVLDLVGAQLVVDQTDEGNGVAEELGVGDGGLPEHHGGGNQQDILEDTAKGHH